MSNNVNSLKKEVARLTEIVENKNIAFDKLDDILSNLSNKITLLEEKNEVNDIKHNILSTILKKNNDFNKFKDDYLEASEILNKISNGRKLTNKEIEYINNLNGFTNQNNYSINSNESITQQGGINKKNKKLTKK